MRISFLRVVLIIVFTIILALIINFLQPNSLPLINKTNNFALQDQSVSNSPLDTSGNLLADKNPRKDRNKIAVEENKDKINDQISPEYDFSDDSNVQTGQAGTNQKNIYQKDDELNLSNLTKDVFNQPRLISLSQAYELYRDKIVFIDARDVELFQKGHIAGAINVPYFALDEFLHRLDDVDKSEPIVTYCEGADCDMSIRLGNELFAKGFRKVFVFFGGWEEWEKSGYPVVTSSSDIKLN
ncbi:MAG TPA: rhodanese-like domain-containing protein [Ignavibacteriaceae bacterium]|nr:rhodanese-like domain-containing protein [Ignavibacteriaceae bacterium]